MGIFRRWIYWSNFSMNTYCLIIFWPSVLFTNKRVIGIRYIISRNSLNPSLPFFLIFFARHSKNFHFPLDTHTVITSFASCYTTLEHHFLFLVYISYLEIKTKNIKTKNNSKFSLPKISHLTLKSPILLNNSLKGTQLSSVETRCMLFQNQK